MANEAKLNLVITAQDNARQVIEELVNSLKEAADLVSGSFSNIQFATRMEEQFRELNSSVGEMSRSFSEGMNSLAQSAQRTSEEVSTAMSEMGNHIEDIGGMMAAQMIGDQLKQIGEAGKEAFLGSVDSAAEFEFNVSRIGAVLTTVGKASSSQMQQMSDMALQLGSHSSFSANQIAEGMYTLARQGLDATTIMGDGVNGAINVVNDLAQATDSSITDTATVITDIIHEYGLSGSELRNVANIMSGTLHNSSENITDLYMSMRQVGPVAAAMHQSVDDVSTALAILAQHGITGSSAGTAMKNMLLGLEPHTAKAAALMKDLGISAKDGAANSFYQLNGNLKPLPEILDILNQKFGGLNDKQKEAALATTFTKYGLAGLNTLVTENRTNFLAYQNELKMDDAATIAGKKYDNLKGDLMRFQAALSTMGKAFGDTMGPALRSVVQETTKFVQWMTALPKPIKEAGMVALGLGSALAIVAGSIISFGVAMNFMTPGFTFLGGVIASTGLKLVTFGGLFTRVGGLVRAFSLAPLISGLTSFIGVLGSGAARLLSWGGIFNIIKQPMILFIEGITNLHHIVPAAIDAIEMAFGRLAMRIPIFFTGIQARLLQFGSYIFTLGPRILAVMTNAFTWTNIVRLVTLAATGIRAAITLMMGPWGLLIAAVVGGVALLITHWSQIKDWVVQHFQGTVPHALQTMQTFFSTTWSQIKNAVQSAMNYVMPTIINGISQVQQWWNSVWPQIYQVLDVTWKLCLAVLAPAMAMIGTIIVAGLGFIKGSWSAGWATVGTVLKTAWDLISSTVSIAFHVITGIISVALDLLTGNFRKAGSDALSTFTKLGGDLRGLFTNLASDAYNFGANIVKMLAGGISGAIGAVTSAASKVVSAVKGIFSGGGSGGSVSVDLNAIQHAKGGIFNQPHLGLVAEAGPEAIIPLSDPVRGLELWKQAGTLLNGFNSNAPGMSTPSISPNTGGGRTQIVQVAINIDGRSAKTDRELTDMIANKFYKQMGIVSI